MIKRFATLALWICQRRDFTSLRVPCVASSYSFAVAASFSPYPVDSICHLFADTDLHEPEWSSPGVPFLSGPLRLAVPVPGGRPQDAAAQASALHFAGQDQ